MKVYPYDYGYCETEQDLVTQLHTFLTSNGWTRIEVVSDTASDRDYAWSSPGEEPDDNDTIYIRIRGYSNYLYNYGYITYTDSGDNTGELFDTTYTRVPTSGYGFRYWIFGDANFVCYTVMNGSDGNPYTAYAGLIRSNYIPETDNLPMIVKGHYSSSISWQDTNNIYLHDPTTSGEQQGQALNWWNTLTYDWNTRTGSVALLPVIIANRNASYYEVRGEPYGVYQINGYNAGNFAPLVSVSGVFMCFKSANSASESYAYGPLASGIEDFNSW